MKRWSVSLPFTGYVVVEVAGETKEAAIDAAFEADIDLLNDLIDIQYHEHVTRGNVTFAVLNDAEAELVEGDDEVSP